MTGTDVLKESIRCQCSHCKEEAMANEIVALRAERDALRKSGLNLLAVAHGDGGHHTGSVGVQQSFADAERAFYALRQDAERVDWLQSRTSFLVHQWQGGGYTLTLPQPPVDGVRPPPIGFTGDALRNAIDAARTAYAEGAP